MTELKTKIKFTYEDYKSLPESETKQHELLKGKLVVIPSPSFKHQLISSNIEFLLQNFVRENQLGIVLNAPLDVAFEEAGEIQVTQPDILYVAKETSRIIAEEEIRGAPDLIVEIISPGTEERDRGYKKTLYARHGVKEYWLVDPQAETIEVLALGEEGFKTVRVYKYGEAAALRSPLLKGLSVDLEEVF
jgi:Uma2 family endonuclease